jgi:hypothetical protein
LTVVTVINLCGLFQPKSLLFCCVASYNYHRPTVSTLPSFVSASPCVLDESAHGGFIFRYAVEIPIDLSSTDHVANDIDMSTGDANTPNRSAKGVRHGASQGRCFDALNRVHDCS